MEYQIVIEIIYDGENGWDLSTAKRLIFKNTLRAIRFAEYYTKMNKCLIKYYTLGMWRASYCNGRQIWNCY